MEILVVTGVLSAALGFALIVSMETYHGSNFRTERNTLITLLQRARSQSMANFCVGACIDGKSHGVAIRPADNPDSYVLFQGPNYANRDREADAVFEASSSVSAKGFSEVVFAQLSAISGTVDGSDLVLFDSVGHVSTTTVGSEGQISWTN